MKRERRWAKKKKTGTGLQPAPVKPETDQLDLFGNGPIPHGFYAYCQARNERIDTAVCIVQQTREPGKCRGCIQFKRG